YRHAGGFGVGGGVAALDSRQRRPDPIRVHADWHWAVRGWSWRHLPGGRGRLMATTVRVVRWDDQPWDAEGLNLTIAVNDTFNVSTIDQSNRVVALTPNATSYTKTLTADNWDDATFWWDGTLSSHFVANQTFTVQTIDLNNRVITLT